MWIPCKFEYHVNLNTMSIWIPCQFEYHVNLNTMSIWIPCQFEYPLNALVKQSNKVVFLCLNFILNCLIGALNIFLLLLDMLVYWVCFPGSRLLIEPENFEKGNSVEIGNGYHSWKWLGFKLNVHCSSAAAHPWSNQIRALALIKPSDCYARCPLHTFGRGH